MKIEAVKMKAPKKGSAPIAITGDLDKDVELAKSWMNFREKLGKYIEFVDQIAVELGFESSEDARTHHAFNADEAVFVSDVRISPANAVIFVVPYGNKEKTFGFAEAELINVSKDGSTEPFNSVVNRLFRESFSDFPEIPTITMLERKYLATMAGLGGMLNDAENFVKNVELNKDRSALYSKLDFFGLF